MESFGFNRLQSVHSLGLFSFSWTKYLFWFVDSSSVGLQLIVLFALLVAGPLHGLMSADTKQREWSGLFVSYRIWEPRRRRHSLFLLQYFLFSPLAFGSTAQRPAEKTTDQPSPAQRSFSNQLCRIICVSIEHTHSLWSNIFIWSSTKVRKEKDVPGRLRKHKDTKTNTELNNNGTILCFSDNHD